jgi:hypothetical protein
MSYGILSLPYVPKPFQNEILHSWLERIACNYGMDWKQLATVQGAAYLNIPDFNVPPETRQFLATIGNVDRRLVTKLDLAQAFRTQPRRRFILHARSRQAIPAYCAGCLRDDVIHSRDSYLRQEWALAGVGHCIVHRALLWSRCHHCWEDIRYVWRCVDGHTRLFCRRCKYGLAEGSRSNDIKWPDECLRAAVIEADAMIIEAMRVPIKAGIHRTRDCPRLLEVFEDLAHFIYRDIPGNGWKSASSRAPINWLAAVITGIGRKGFGIPDEKYPLANRSAAVRSWLVAACLYVLFSDCLLRPEDEAVFGFRPSLKWLLQTLDKQGRQELKVRARRWPQELLSPFDVKKGKKTKSVPIMTFGMLLEGVCCPLLRADGYSDVEARRKFNTAWDRLVADMEAKKKNASGQDRN